MVGTSTRRLNRWPACACAGTDGGGGDLLARGRAVQPVRDHAGPRGGGGVGRGAAAAVVRVGGRGDGRRHGRGDAAGRGRVPAARHVGGCVAWGADGRRGGG